MACHHHRLTGLALSLPGVTGYVSIKTVPRPPIRVPRSVPAPAANGVPRERLNTRLLAILIGGTILLAAGWYSLNRWQVRRHATALLAQADAAESQGRPDRAARLVGLYIGFVPTDTEARARFGRLLDSFARTPRARAGV